MSASTSPGALGAPVAFAAQQDTEAAALHDRSWFADHPDRRVRARSDNGGLWLIRRLRRGADPDVLLRAFSRTIVPASRDGDSDLGGLWYTAAYPDWPPEKVWKAARKALCKPRP
jgi:hypothetical protein